MREVKCLSGRQVRFHRGPYRHNGRIGQQAHDDSTLLASILNAEQSFTRNPSVCHCLLVSLTLTLAYDYVETIVAQVASLTGTLYTITDNCDCFIL